MIKELMKKWLKQTEGQLQIDVEEVLCAQRKRNEERIEKIKAEMGTKYILHPSHMKHKLDAPRPV